MIWYDAWPHRWGKQTNTHARTQTNLSPSSPKWKWFPHEMKGIMGTYFNYFVASQTFLSMACPWMDVDLTSGFRGSCAVCDFMICRLVDDGSGTLQIWWMMDQVDGWWIRLMDDGSGWWLMDQGLKVNFLVLVKETLVALLSWRYVYCSALVIMNITDKSWEGLLYFLIIEVLKSGGSWLHACELEFVFYVLFFIFENTFWTAAFMDILWLVSLLPAGPRVYTWRDCDYGYLL